MDDAFLMADKVSRNNEVLEKDSQFETKNTPSFLPGTSGGHMSTLSTIDKTYWEHFVLFAVGTLVLAMLIVCCRRIHYSRRRQKRRLKAWTNEINFQDECESTDESMDSIEDGHIRNHPIDRNDWLASVGYENADEGHANPFVFAEKTMSDSSGSSYGGDDDNDIGLFHALNGDSSSSEGSSPPRSPRLTLDNPPPPPRITTTGLLGSPSGTSPPTVSELFQNTISSHWKMASPLNLGGGEGSNDNFDEELAAVRAELKQEGL